VGKHPSYTRVVFELDEAVDYTIRPRADAREIVVDLDAGSGRRVMTSRSDLVESVSLQPAAVGAVAHIRLRSGPVHVTEMLLSDPPRIVLDLRADPAAASEPVAPTAGTEEPVETAQPDPTEPTRDPSAQPPLVVAGAPDVSAGAIETREPSAGEGLLDEAPLDGGEPDLDPWAELDVPDPTAAAGDLAAIDPGDADPDAGLEAPDDLLTASTEPAVVPTPIAASEPSTDESPALATLPEGLDSRILLGLGGALVVAVLLVAWTRSRRRDKRSGLFSTAIPHLRDVEPEVEASPEPFEDRTLPSFVEAEPDLPDDRSLFDSTVGIEEAAVDEEEKPEVTHGRAGGVTPRGVGMSSPGSVEELEQRLLSLERRLEEVLDAKDRLERHVAAQTEELRVQRAAIARTQRVLRNLTRPDDAPTEPALKARE
jgi:hypothetical protein